MCNMVEETQSFDAVGIPLKSISRLLFSVHLDHLNTSFQWRKIPRLKSLQN